MIAPTYAKAAEDNTDIEFAKVDVDNEELEVRRFAAKNFATELLPQRIKLIMSTQAIVGAQGVSAMPTFMMYKDGKIVSVSAELAVMACWCVMGSTYFFPGQDRHWRKQGEDRRTCGCCQGVMRPLYSLS